MLNTVRAILESKGFDFSNMEEGSITRADHIEGKNYACTGISYSNSDPILDKIIPFDTGENFAISSGEWIVRVDGGNLDAYNSLSE